MVRRFALAVMAVLVLSLLPHFHDHSSGSSGAFGASCSFCLAGGATPALASSAAGSVAWPEFDNHQNSFLRPLALGQARYFLTSARPRDPPFQKS